MALYLGVLLFSFILTGIAVIPFIDLLFRFRLVHSQTNQAWHNRKLGTPIGGGVLIITLVSFLYALLFPLLPRLGISPAANFLPKDELNVIFFSFISFGILGLYDDLVKIFHLPQNSHKNQLQFLLSVVVALLLYFNLGLRFFHLPLLGPIQLGWLFIPASTLIIYALGRGFDISDGLDGLACGILLISLFAFWLISFSALDTIISLFISLWMGGLLAFLYFNVYPARIWLGNSGAVSFGSTLAVLGLVLGKTAALLVICSPFLLEGLSNLLQTVHFKLTGQPLFSAAPVHYLLERRGWSEPKIVMRTWILSLVLAIFGLWLAH